MKKIIHIDMDAFYASVEQRDNPSFRGKPVIVGGSPKSRSVVSTCSYEARQYGIHSAMPTAEAYRRCPHGIFVTHANFSAYKRVSVQINGIFRDVTNLVEPLSLDEAYLDVTSNTINQPSATRIAEYLRQRIKVATGLTASAGVSYNKSLAKIASDWHKPDGLTVITPDMAMDFLERLPIRKFFGIGPVTAARMEKLGIYTGGDLRAWSKWHLIEKFGKAGPWYYEVCRGIDGRDVVAERIRKSLSKERTFKEDKMDIAEMLHFLADLSGSVWQELQEKKLSGKTVTLKVKFADFHQITRSRTLGKALDSLALLQSIAGELLKETKAGMYPVRLLGIGVSSFNEEKSKERMHQLEFEFPT